MKYHFKIHKEIKGYWAECVEIEGCQTQGGTLSELNQNMAEALNLMLSEPMDSKMIFPLPKQNLKGKSIVAVAVDSHLAFAVMIRRSRLTRNWTQRDAARELNIKHLSAYQRLESPKSNPELETILRIKQMFPEIMIDQLL
jgi:predicted RNase H-like HicB family nuclease/DNA-binding XRE family transcriptional regulator